MTNRASGNFFDSDFLFGAPEINRVAEETGFPGNSQERKKPGNNLVAGLLSF